jgi:hypothetical protein
MNKINLFFILFIFSILNAQNEEEMQVLYEYLEQVEEVKSSEETIKISQEVLTFLIPKYYSSFRIYPIEENPLFQKNKTTPP